MHLRVGWLDRPFAPLYGPALPPEARVQGDDRFTSQLASGVESAYSIRIIVWNRRGQN